MPVVSYDGKSFSIDGKRVWLVSGSIDYLRIPSGQWRATLRAAAEAGLNCIETRVVWNAHEREPGVFDFTGDLDLRGFVQAVADAGMYCILRPGPYVGGGYDFGGLPSYLHGVEDRKTGKVRYRENEPQFMEAVDRYMRAVMEQVGDLQVASNPSPGSSEPHPTVANGYNGAGGGPIVMMQAEHAWLSHNPDKGDDYHVRLVSMLRQHGCVVPICNANNLWQPVEGTFDTWSGSTDLPAMTRQLSQIAPQTPPMVMELPTDAAANAWDVKPTDTIDADLLAYRLAGLIGVGAQFNLYPFAQGLDLGFYPGPSHRDLIDGVGQASERDTPLNDAGQRSDKYAVVKRLCTFASHFGSVLSGRTSTPAPTAALTEADHPTAILHHHGSQGTLIMLVKSANDKTAHTALMLPNGLTLDVPHKGQRAAWVLIDTPLAGHATLDYTNLSPWALVGGKLLVVFGPAGSEGIVSIDGQHHAVTVPTGKTPLVIEGDAIHLAILNQDQVDAATISPSGLIIGCYGLDDEGQPRPLKGWGTQSIITADGEISSKRSTQRKTPTTPKLTAWQTLSLKTLIEGTDASYREIDSPASLGELGQTFGYGWYKLSGCKPEAGKVMAVDGGDRLHCYQTGKLAGLLGIGEGASDAPSTIKLKGDAVVLADNLGHVSDGQGVGLDPKGLPDHLYTVKPIKPGKAQVSKQTAGDPFALHALAIDQHAGVRSMSEAIAWTIKPDNRKPIIVDIHGLDQPCVISVNDEPIRYYVGIHSSHRTRLLLDPTADGPTTGGKNIIKLELLSPLAKGVAIDKHVSFYQTTGTATPKTGWSFAPWQVPASDDENWRALPKTLPSQPAWLRCTFEVSSTDTPLYLDPAGLSKGQAYLNGHNLGRYWHQTREGKLVNPQQRLYLPACWLKSDAPNELMLFDEHGRTPDSCELAYKA